MHFGNEVEIKYEREYGDIYGNVCNVLFGFLNMAIFRLIVGAF